MVRSRKSDTPEHGLPPGTLVHSGEHKLDNLTFRLCRYNEHRFEDRTLKSVSECLELKDDQQITWINVQGLQEVEKLQALAEGFAWHPLVLKDMVNTSQRPKFEDYGDCLFIVLKRPFFPKGSREFQVNHVSIITGAHYVVSFQQGGDDAFSTVLDRLRNNRGQTRKMGADFLSYELVNTLVDNCFIVLEQLDHEIETVEQELIENPTSVNVRTFHTLKREILTLRSFVWPIREGISHVQNVRSPLFTESTRIYVRDLHGHLYAIMETTDSLRDVVSGMFDVYLTSVSNQMNGTMKVLAVIATIFVPMTFLTGMYGMNFTHMPGLDWWWGFPVFLGIILGLAGSMLVHFKRIKWI